MALEDAPRLVRYSGDGTTTAFPFSFRIFEPDELTVSTGKGDGSEVETVLTYETDYTVTLNDDQGTNPGGTVTLVTAPETGTNVALVSAIPYEQPMVLTPYDGFNPETLNDNADLQCAQIQQLAEKLDRAITVDATDTMSATELKNTLLSAADSAYELAMQYAKQAGESAEKAEASAKEAADTAAQAKTDLEAQLTESKADVVAEGDKQVERVEAAGNNELVAMGIGGIEVFWTLDADVASGTEITIPESAWYVVGRHHMQVRWNGCACFIGAQFEEVGEADSKGTKFKLLFDAKSGDELDVLITALGTGNVDEAIAKAESVSDALADLSSRVVYKSEQAASGE